MRLRTGTDYASFIPYVAIGLVVLGIDFLGWLSGVRALSERLINPLSTGITVVAGSVVKPFHAARFMLQGPERLTDLEARYAEALVKADRVAELEAENVSLRKLLGSGALPEYEYVPVRTISVGGELVMAAGSAKGIQAGESVVDDNHILIGRVNRVSPWTSWANRVGATQVSVPVVIGTTKISGVMQSDGNKGVVEVEQADQVREGDIVETSGVKGEYVSGLVIGRVIQVEPESANVYKKVWVEPLHQPGDVVYLVRGKSQ